MSTEEPKVKAMTRDEAAIIAIRDGRVIRPRGYGGWAFGWSEGAFRMVAVPEGHELTGKPIPLSCSQNWEVVESTPVSKETTNETT